MFLQSQKDIASDKDEEQTISLRSLKPKLITSLNHEQESVMRRVQKRKKKRSINKSLLSVERSLRVKDTFKSDHKEKEDKLLFREVYDGDDRISGYWLNGLLDGEAEIDYSNGDHFKGHFKKGYKMHGTMQYKGQCRYTGKFLNEQFHGKGVLRLNDKTITAQWAHGVAEGNCAVQYKNGNIYYGPMKNFKKHGYGYIYFPNDTKFAGQFYEGSIKGYGEYYEGGKLTKKGLWKNGQLVEKIAFEEPSYMPEDEEENWQRINGMFKNNPMITRVITMLDTAVDSHFANNQDYEDCSLSSIVFSTEST